MSRIASVLPGLRRNAHRLRGRLTVPKAYVTHLVALGIVAGVVVVNMATGAMGRESVLYRMVGEGEVIVGPLSADGAGGGNFAFARSPLAGGIGEADIEFELANTLSGNALMAMNAPAISGEEGGLNSEVAAHTVEDGETPSTIAARYGVSTDSILWSNGISASDTIKPGDILVVPPVSGLVHTVERGDTISGIARKYDASVEDILEQNGFSAGATIAIGEELVVPDGRIPPPPTPRPVVASAQQAAPAPAVAPAASAAAPSAGGFIWPTPAVRGISQYFGWRHTGIDIPNRSLPPVHAAKAGTVTFSGWLGGYGRLVIIDHGGGVVTYYAHLNQQYVSKGEAVSQGQAIGQLGNTGRSTGPHLHFEIRINGRPVNPLNYL